MQQRRGRAWRSCDCLPAEGRRIQPTLLGVGGADVKFEVESVQSFGGYVLHVGSISQGELGTGSQLACDVGYDRRKLITNSHTLTHVINLALHQVRSEQYCKALNNSIGDG